MSHDVWEPQGFGDMDLSFAPPLLNDQTSCVPLQFVVPGVIPVASLQTWVANQEARLRLPRAAVHFPLEQAGDALSWWNQFLDTESERLSNACETCVRIQTELASIIIRQQTSLSEAQKAQNNAKTKRRAVLKAELDSHECADRDARVVPMAVLESDKILRGLLGSDHQELAVEEQEAKTERKLPAPDAREADVAEYVEPDDGMPTIRLGTAPVAYTRRNKGIKAGDFAVIVPEAEEGEWMGDHPFWLVKVVRLTTHKHVLHFFGDQFLGPYYPLIKSDGSDYVDEFPKGAITYVHWDSS